MNNSNLNEIDMIGDFDYLICATTVFGIVGLRQTHFDTRVQRGC